MVYGFSDMFYYVSTDGKAAIRGDTEQIVQFVEAGQGDPREPISLTMVGHSAGSVIAFDFCYYLFAQEDRRFVRDPARGIITSKSGTCEHSPWRTLASSPVDHHRLARNHARLPQRRGCGNACRRRTDRSTWYGLTQNPAIWPQIARPTLAQYLG